MISLRLEPRTTKVQGNTSPNLFQSQGPQRYQIQVQTCFRLLDFNFNLYYSKNGLFTLGKKLLNQNEYQI